MLKIKESTAFVPVVLATGATLLLVAALAADESRSPGKSSGSLSTATDSDCGCSGRKDTIENATQKPYRVIATLAPRLNERDLRDGEDLALIYTDLAEFTKTVPPTEEPRPDYYLLRLHGFGAEAFVTIVDDSGIEIPLDVLGVEARVQFCKPHENDIDGCFPETDECVVECDHHAGFCVQTCIVNDTWPDEFPPMPQPE